MPALPRPSLGRPCAGSPLLVSLSFRSPGRFCVLRESRRPPRGGPGGFLQSLAPRVDRRLEGVRGLPRLGHSSWGPPTPRDEDALPRRQARQLATEPREMLGGHLNRACRRCKTAVSSKAINVFRDDVSWEVDGEGGLPSNFLRSYFKNFLERPACPLGWRWHFGSRGVTGWLLR